MIERKQRLRQAGPDENLEGLTMICDYHAVEYPCPGCGKLACSVDVDVKPKPVQVLSRTSEFGCAQCGWEGQSPDGWWTITRKGVILSVPYTLLAHPAAPWYLGASPTVDFVDAKLTSGETGQSTP